MRREENTPISAVLVDDERLARTELTRLLSAHPEVTVVGEAANLDEARSVIATEHPDLVFLDIQLPDGVGFDLFAAENLPAVVFTTAFDHFAVHAFEVEALDYLLKPIDPRRLAMALARVANHLSASIAGTRPTTMEPLAPADQVLARDGQRGFLVRIADIRLFEVEKSYTKVVWKQKELRIDRSLSVLEERLSNCRFFRANRKQLINLRWVVSVDEWFHGQVVAELRSGERIIFSRRRARVFRDQSRL